MRPPSTTILGLLCDLARCYPARTLAIGLGAMVLIAMATHSHRPALDACLLEQEWFDGDLHFNATLVLEADGGGAFIESGLDSDAPQRRFDFRWTKDGQSITVDINNTRGTLRYEIGRWDTGTCWLRFREQGDVPPPLRWGLRLFTNRRGW